MIKIKPYGYVFLMNFPMHDKSSICQFEIISINYFWTDILLIIDASFFI